MSSFNGNIGTPSGGFNLKVEYSISQSISGNYSDISATGYVKRNNSSYYPYNSSSSSSLSINGSSVGYSGSYDLRSDGYKSIVSNTVRVYHNADGTKSTTISFSFNGKLSSYYPNGSINQTITLPTIPRQATLTSAQNFTDEENPTIIYSNPAGNSVTTLEICITIDDVAVIPYRTVSKTGSSYTFNLTEAERNSLRLASTNSSNKSVRYILYSKIGINDYWSSINKKLTIINANPIFNDFTYEDTNPTTLALTGNNQTIIKGHSNLQIDISSENKAIALKGATIPYYKINNDAYPYQDTFTKTLENYNLNNVIVYAIDSRGNSTPITKVFPNFIEYQDPNIGIPVLDRTGGINEETTLEFSGTWWNSNFGTTINSINVVYKYKEKGQADSEYVNGTSIINPTIDGNNISFSGVIKGDLDTGFDTTKQYDIKVILTDSVSSYNFYGSVAVGDPAMDVYENNVCLGGVYDTSVGGRVQLEGQILTLGNKSIMTIASTNNQTFTSTEAYTSYIIDLDRVISRSGNKLTMENNGIKIGSGVSKVIVSGCISTNGQTSNKSYGGRINKNGGEQMFILWSPVSGNYSNVVLSQSVIDVNEGDLITLGIYLDQASTFNVRASNYLSFTYSTYLTVEVVD